MKKLIFFLVVSVSAYLVSSYRASPVMTGKPPIECAANQTYSRCVPFCPPTCHLRLTCLIVLDPNNCITRAGCTCSDGYQIRPSDNACVLPQDCGPGENIIL